MTVHARVFTADGIERHDDVGSAVAATGETWIHVDDVAAVDVAALQEATGIHPLAVEDVRDEHTRPKTEEYDTHTFVLLKTAVLETRDVAFHKEVRLAPVGLFVGPDWLVTMTTDGGDVVDAEADRWLSRAERIASRGTDFVAYRIVDGIVDDYFLALDDIEDDIEAIEERVLDRPDPEILEELNGVRRDLLAFRKVAWPAREAIAVFSRGDVEQVAEENEKYFRDVYDHLVQVVDLVETYRDLTIGSREIYLSSISQSTNEVMKTLTVVATIFIPLTFVAGVYGMNFSDSPYAMPELTWTYGYPAVWVVMLVIAAVMIGYFRRLKWI